VEIGWESVYERFLRPMTQPAVDLSQKHVIEVHGFTFTIVSAPAYCVSRSFSCASCRFHHPIPPYLRFRFFLSPCRPNQLIFIQPLSTGVDMFNPSRNEQEEPTIWHRELEIAYETLHDGVFPTDTVLPSFPAFNFPIARKRRTCDFEQPSISATSQSKQLIGFGSHQNGILLPRIQTVRRLGPTNRRYHQLDASYPHGREHWEAASG